MLLSHVVEDVKAWVKASCIPELISDTGWGYYYCYYVREQDETPHMVRWFINKLCRQMNSIPLEVREIYEEGGQPTTPQLMGKLAAVVKSFKRVYLVIDALDESSNRENLLSFLNNISDHTDVGGVQLLAMTRKEIDIERALLYVSKDMSLSNQSVDDDIRVYIQHRLHDDWKFNRWPQELGRKFETALVQGTKGMHESSCRFTVQGRVILILHRFRWVVCQLDILEETQLHQKYSQSITRLARNIG